MNNLISCIPGVKNEHCMFTNCEKNCTVKMNFGENKQFCLYFTEITARRQCK